MSQNTDDPLDGFRARTADDEQNEVIVRSIRGLSEMGIDHGAISDIIASQDLIDALKNTETILAKLVTYCVNTLKENQWKWTASNEPASMHKEHLEARAARMVIAWIESIHQTGEVAEQLIEQQDVVNHDE